MKAILTLLGLFVLIAFFLSFRSSETTSRVSMESMEVERSAEDAAGSWLGVEVQTSVPCSLTLFDDGMGFFVHDILLEEYGAPIPVKWEYRKRCLFVTADDSDGWVNFCGSFRTWSNEPLAPVFLFLNGRGQEFNYDVVLYRDAEWSEKIEMVNNLRVENKEQASKNGTE